MKQLATKRSFGRGAATIWIGRPRHPQPSLHPTSLTHTETSPVSIRWDEEKCRLVQERSIPDSTVTTIRSFKAPTTPVTDHESATSTSSLSVQKIKEKNINNEKFTDSVNGKIMGGSSTPPPRKRPNRRVFGSRGRKRRTIDADVLLSVDFDDIPVYSNTNASYQKKKGSMVSKSTCGVIPIQTRINVTDTHLNGVHNIAIVAQHNDNTANILSAAQENETPLQQFKTNQHISNSPSTMDYNDESTDCANGSASTGTPSFSELPCIYTKRVRQPTATTALDVARAYFRKLDMSPIVLEKEGGPSPIGRGVTRTRRKACRQNPIILQEYAHYKDTCADADVKAISLDAYLRNRSMFADQGHIYEGFFDE